ncbi:hypothetical protein FQN57_002982 [Myotisia sp. PD_48]|nr:hypothetical protein FQN57_002982 [Myotisia sp. PD_48]
MATKKAIHFGGGNIGRGFVGEFLHESGYEVVFIDVVDQIINALQSTPSYTVTEISSAGEHVKTISNYRAINSKHNLQDVINEISTAEVVTCAVGPNILKFIADPIAKGIDARIIERPLAVIACENAIGATDTLHGFIKQHTDDARLQSLSKRARFANSAIDRIVPTQAPDAGLNVKIEKFYEWAVDKTPFGEWGPPAIQAIHWVDNLEPYIERKLYTVNTGHATAAYYGYRAGKKTIYEALSDPKIRGHVNEALSETSNLIVTKHKIPVEEQRKYVNAIIERISNPHLEDVVERVGRAPLRKLSRKERFIGPASQLAELGQKTDALVAAVEQALRFQNVAGDDESFELAKILKDQSAESATTKLTGLTKEDALYERILERVKDVQGGSRYG